MQIDVQFPPSVTRRLALWAVGCVAVGAGYWWMSAPSATSTIAVAPVAHAAAAATGVIVDVQGAVRHPGVFRLPAGARVIDAVRAAGGVQAGHRAIVNLARPVVDGEQLMIGAASGVAAGSAGPSSSGRIGINSADATAFDALPGIGAVLAKRIVDYRAQHGPFRTLRDLLDVPGIGDAKYADLADAISLS